MKEIKSIVGVFSILTIGLFTVLSCEPDADELGKQFFKNNTGTITEQSFDIVAYNVDNKDSIRSDSRNIGNVALLGAFKEDVFGMRKASYVTQFTPNNFNLSFGKNPVVDSVVLQITPRYKQDSVVITPEIYEDSQKTISTYPLELYGKRKNGNNPTTLTVKVEEINEFIGSSDPKIFSDKKVDIANFLGQTEISTKISSEKITNNTGEELSTKNAVIRIKLDTDIFKEKIVKYEGKSEISDVASFVRHFKGIRISVNENDGFLFYFDPSKVSLSMYYSYDREGTNNGTTTRQSGTLSFNLGNPNTRFSQFEFDRSTDYTNIMDGIDVSQGDSKLYLQGAGGASAEFMIPDSKIKELRNIYLNDKVGILSAKIRLYSDDSWNNNFEKPSDFTILQKGEEKFMDDLIILSQIGRSQVNANNLDKNPAYYDLDITQTVKNIVEKGADNKHITMSVGSFTVNQQGAFTGWNNTTRAYTPYRIVLVGSDPSNDKRVQLKVVYAKK